MKFLLTCVLFGLLAVDVCRCDEGKETESAEGLADKSLSDIGEMFVQPAKGLGDWFKNAADEVKERSESGMETMKEFSEQAKEKSEGAMKSLGEGIGERFGKAKEKLQEHGEKMKEALTNAAEKTKEEMESAASKVSKHANDASNLMFSMFG